MIKENLATLVQDMSTEELDAVIYYLQALRLQRGSHEATLTDEEITELMTPNPKDGAWIVANSPEIGILSDMTEDTLEWSKELRRKIESRTTGDNKK
ncbi:MAG: hypothetical protein SFZ02_03640 [bacterium]|nr:hypothetical protein [bacterium]